MNHSASVLPLCPACKKGNLHELVRTEVFRPRDVEVRVELLTSSCDACHVETTRASQHNENLRRLAARKMHYGDLLLGEEIVTLRKRYGLTQQAAARIFGTGKVSFSRYENETSYPDKPTTLLLTIAIEKPDSLKWLADRAGVEIPLWRDRCEDGRLSIHKVSTHPIKVERIDSASYELAATQQTHGSGLDGWHEIHDLGRASVESVRVETCKDQLAASALEAA